MNTVRVPCTPGRVLIGIVKESFQQQNNCHLSHNEALHVRYSETLHEGHTVLAMYVALKSVIFR